MMEKKLDIRRSRSAMGVLLRTMALSALILLGAAVVRADTVLDWNITALKTTASAPFNPPVESRSLAIVHAAMFDRCQLDHRRVPPLRDRVQRP